MRRVLFICTGNYYRSRFAEELFNARASGLGWTADSRGIELGSDNVGAISCHVVERLKAWGIALHTALRFPTQLREEDVARADLIIALDEPEHRPALENHFPEQAHRIEYWHVPDLERAAPEETLSTIEREIETLIRRLAVAH